MQISYNAFKSSLVTIILALGLSFSAGAAYAEDNNALIEKLLKCKANAQEVDKFNKLVDAKKMAFKADAAHAPFGGLAWTLPAPVALGGKSSGTFVMNTREEFYLLIPSKNPKDDLAAVAQNLKLKKVLDMQGYFDYQRDEGAGAVRALSTEDAKKDFYVGCTYSK